MEFQEHIKTIKRLVDTNVRFRWYNYNFNMKEALDYIDSLNYLKTKSPSQYYATVYDLLAFMTQEMYKDRKKTKEHLDILFDTFPFSQNKQDQEVEEKQSQKEINKIIITNFSRYSEVLQKIVNKLTELDRKVNSKSFDKPKIEEETEEGFTRCPICNIEIAEEHLAGHMEQRHQESMEEKTGEDELDLPDLDEGEDEEWK